MVNLKLKITNKTFALIAGFLILVGIAGFSIAYNSGQPASVHGHDAGEISGLSTGTGGTTFSCTWKFAPKGATYGQISLATAIADKATGVCYCGTGTTAQEVLGTTTAVRQLRYYTNVVICDDANAGPCTTPYAYLSCA